MLKIFYFLNKSIDQWLTYPETKVAGRLGIFRILYAIFYIWFLSSQFAIKLAYLPKDLYFHRIFLIDFFPKPLSVEMFGILESTLVTLLILLLIGLRVQIVTAFILVLGCILEAFYYSNDSEHATIFLVFYIPLFMFLNEGWADTYSLDYLIKKRKGKEIVDASNSSSKYSISIKCILVVLSLLWFSSGISKILGGTWLSEPSLMINHVLKQNVEAAIYELPLNPLAPWMAETPIVHNTLRFFTVFFESTFIFALFNRNR